MDQRITDALAFANYRLTLQTHRQNILARVEAALLVSYQNAIFRSSPELISFVGIQAARSNQPLYVDDTTGNTQCIEDANEFLEFLIRAYDTAYSLKHQEQEKLKTSRTPSKIVGI